MKATELRIGNYIRHGDYDIIVGPAFFTSFDNYDFENDGIFKPEIQPIPLTEEWLLKFGFSFYQLTEQGRFFIKNNVEVLQSHDRKQFWIFDKDILVEHVHQFQNLYFALTGEELNK